MVVGKRLVPIYGARTDASGVASVTFVLFSTASYELVYASTPKYAGSKSASATVTVDQTATTLTAAAATASINKGSLER